MMNPLSTIGITFEDFVRHAKHATIILLGVCCVYLYQDQQSRVEEERASVAKTEQESCSVRVQGFEKEIQYSREKEKAMQAYLLKQQELLLEKQLTQKLP